MREVGFESSITYHIIPKKYKLIDIRNIPMNKPKMEMWNFLYLKQVGNNSSKLMKTIIPATKANMKFKLNSLIKG